jgi:hypothetical protein
MIGDPENDVKKPAPDMPSHPDQQPGEAGIPVNAPPPDEQQGGEPTPASEKDDEDAEDVPVK